MGTNPPCIKEDLQFANRETWECFLRSGGLEQAAGAERRPCLDWGLGAVCFCRDESGPAQPTDPDIVSGVAWQGAMETMMAGCRLEGAVC